MIRTRKTETVATRVARVSQGDIVRDVEYIENVTEEDGVLEVSKIVFPLAIVLTQDCDLESEARARRLNAQVRGDTANAGDKTLLSVLMAPLYNVQHVYTGEHLVSLGVAAQPVPKGSAGDFLKTNQRERYHYLEFSDGVLIVPQVIDFKHYFSVTLKKLEDFRLRGFVCSVSPLFREQISQRFANYLSRIGLPDAKPAAAPNPAPSMAPLAVPVALSTERV
jgi:hypothetical protein